MDLSDVQEKLYPQKIILDTSIQTVTGEPVPAGTEICVLLCDKLVVCVDDEDYVNVNIGCSKETTDRFDRIYLNPGNQESFADIHRNGETFNSFEKLCCERPRFFSCSNDLFAFDGNDCVKVKSGEKLEFKTIQADTNVRKTPKTSIVVLSNRENYQVHIPSANNYTFQGLEDPNHYTSHELIDNFPLPRQVKIIDERLGVSYRCSKELNLQSVTTKYFLLFTSELKTGPPISGFELRHQVKCCELYDPRAVKIRTRIDNSQIDDTFSTIFLFGTSQDDRMVFSVLGRQDAVSRLKAGRLDCKDNDSGFSDSDLESCMSTLAIRKRKTSNIQHISGGKNTQSKQTKPRCIRRLSTKDDFFGNSIDDSNTTSTRSFRQFVGFRLDIEKTSNIQYISESNNTLSKQTKPRRIRRLTTKDDFFLYKFHR
ncbi:uncharacterized protein LOC134711500 [Mytilus trossulus]|uniref:uncharacterized protein LOC134711500 n=1 Tax=Mytilus trossulus TaxID=6551 RepID=UPI003007A4D4